MPKRTLLEVSHISSKGGSMRITIPKKIGSQLMLDSSDIVAFYEENGKIFIDKLR